MRTAVLIGGSGFVGSFLANRLAQTGWRVRVPTRRRDNARTLFTLPNVDIIEASVFDERALLDLLDGAESVVNLVGILHGRRGNPYGEDFRRVHVELPALLSRCCAKASIQHFVHVSALGADSNGPSMYLRSKGDGEKAAMAQPELKCTVLRPSVIFGDGDSFLTLFANLQSLLPAMPLGSSETKFAPVWVGDVSTAIQRLIEPSITRKMAAGQIYELTGPDIFTLRELVERAGAYSGHKSLVIALPRMIAWLQAWMMELVPGEPLMSRDNLDSMKVDNISSTPFPAIFGIKPQHLDDIAPTYLRGTLYPGVRADRVRTP